MYCGEKVRLRAYKEEDIPLATKFVNDRELKKLLVTNIPFPMTNWEEESWIKSQKSNDNGQYNFAIEDIETIEAIEDKPIEQGQTTCQPLYIVSHPCLLR